MLTSSTTSTFQARMRARLRSDSARSKWRYVDGTPMPSAECSVWPLTLQAATPVGAVITTARRNAFSSG